MPAWKLAALLLLIPSLLAGCGGKSSASSTKSASSSTAATVTPASAADSSPSTRKPSSPRPLIAVVEEGSPNTLRLITLDGRPVAQTAVPSSGSAAGVVGDMATFVVGEELKALRPSGAVETLGPLPGHSAGRIAISPDGRQWMWSIYSTRDSSVSSKLVLSSRSTDQTVAEQTTTTEPRALQPFRWGAAGPIYQSSAMGLGGYILFDEYTTGPTWRLDPATGQRTSLLTGMNCLLADLATDGTMACFERGNSTILNILSPAGHVVQVPLPLPTFRQAGAVSFKPGSNAATLVIGGATGVGADGGREQYETDLVDIGARSLHRFGPVGLRPGDGPWSWLPDGSLIAYRPPGASGGDPGIYLIAPDGAAKRVYPSGRPVGVITA